MIYNWSRRSCSNSISNAGYVSDYRASGNFLAKNLSETGYIWLGDGGGLTTDDVASGRTESPDGSNFGCYNTRDVALKKACVLSLSRYVGGSSYVGGGCNSHVDSGGCPVAHNSYYTVFDYNSYFRCSYCSLTYCRGHLCDGGLDHSAYWSLVSVTYSC